MGSVNRVYYGTMRIFFIKNVCISCNVSTSNSEYFLLGVNTIHNLL